MESLVPSARVLMSFLFLVPAAMLALSAEKTAPQRRYIQRPGRTLQLPFSDGVLAGNTLYIAGNIGLDPKTGKLPEGIEDEARLALDGIKATLAEAGMTMDDLVSVQIFCPDVSLFSRFNAVYRTYFQKEFPARA
jgi:2-iminobutanoate/2-iminopropanoate deaminase